MVYIGEQGSKEGIDINISIQKLYLVTEIYSYLHLYPAKLGPAAGQLSKVALLVTELQRATFTRLQITL